MVLAFLKSVVLNMRLLVVCLGSGFNGKQSKTQRKLAIDLPKSQKKIGTEEISRLSRLFPLQHALHNQKWCEIGGPTPEICSKSDVLSVKC